MNETRALAAIRTITEETGFPPDPDELAAALAATTKQVHSALLSAKRSGLIRYDEDGRLVAGLAPAGRFQ